MEYKMKNDGAFKKLFVMVLLCIMGYGAAAQTADAQQQAGDSTKQKNIKIDPWQDVFTASFYTESVFGPGWAPILCLVPDLNLNATLFGKLTFSTQANCLISNWGHTKEFSIAPYSMSLSAAVKTGAGQFGIRAGHIVPNSGYCIQGAWDNTTPLSAIFHSAGIGSAGNLPRAIMLRWAGKSVSVIGGYVEMDVEKPGIKLNGKNPALVAAAEASIGDGRLKARCALMFINIDADKWAETINTDEGYVTRVVGSIYLIAKPTKNFEILANCVNIGTDKILATFAQRYTISKNGMTATAVQIWQNNGVKGAWLGLVFPFGAYVDFGITKNDLRYIVPPDDKTEIQPSFGVGYVNTLKFKKK